MVDSLPNDARHLRSQLEQVAQTLEGILPHIPEPGSREDSGKLRIKNIVAALNLISQFTANVEQLDTSAKLETVLAQVEARQDVATRMQREKSRLIYMGKPEQLCAQLVKDITALYQQTEYSSQQLYAHAAHHEETGKTLPFTVQDARTVLSSDDRVVFRSVRHTHDGVRKTEKMLAKATKAYLIPPAQIMPLKEQLTKLHILVTGEDIPPLLSKNDAKAPTYGTVSIPQHSAPKEYKINVPDELAADGTNANMPKSSPLQVHIPGVSPARIKSTLPLRFPKVETPQPHSASPGMTVYQMLIESVAGLEKAEAALQGLSSR